MEQQDVEVEVTIERIQEVMFACFTDLEERNGRGQGAGS